jgi:hypothetical protein
VFAAWADGPAANPRVITAPAGPAAYTANFTTQYLLTANVSPAGAGTVSGAGYHDSGATVSVLATANAGYLFSAFSGDLTGGANPQNLVMSGPKTVTANFTARPETLMPDVTAKTGPPENRIWTITLMNHGPGAGNAAQITALTFDRKGDSDCVPSVITSFPVSVGNLAPRSQVSANVAINFTGCAPATRFSIEISYTANGGIDAGTKKLNNQYQ